MFVQFCESTMKVSGAQLSIDLRGTLLYLLYSPTVQSTTRPLLRLLMCLFVYHEELSEQLVLHQRALDSNPIIYSIILYDLQLSRWMFEWMAITQKMQKHNLLKFVWCLFSGLQIKMKRKWTEPYRNSANKNNAGSCDSDMRTLRICTR